MKKNLLTFLILFIGFSGLSQVNMTELSNLDYMTLHGVELNDIWGYVDEVGNEYACVGTTGGTSIVDVTNPAAPVEVFWLQGMSSTWRDLKVWKDYLYVTTEAEEGLVVIDLGPLPSSTSLTSTVYTGPSGNQWESAHNIYIDENGIAYIFGANRGNGGVIMLDVDTNPGVPQEVGEFDTWYAHDGYANNDILYGAHVFDGVFSIVDVTNKSNPILLGTKATPDFFTHNIWESSDGTHAFTTDEVPGAFIGSYDISNTNNLVEVDRIQSSPGTGVIPHNAHTLGDFIVTSYYRDGVTIHDVSRPHNLVEVGRYDTSPLDGNGFNGCWGAYPYLPSGNVIVSDIEQGLFVLGAVYQKGCYVEGLVTDSVTMLPIQGAEVTIQSEIQTDFSKFDGAYAVSTVNSGLKTVEYNKVGYEKKTLALNLVNGQLINQDVQLVPLVPYPFTIKVVDQVSGALINNADVRLETSDIQHDGVTNGIGEEDFTLFYQKPYAITVGKWGYATHCEITLIDSLTGQMTITLSEGIYDDFTFDFGWSTNGTATTGLWERGVPIGGNGLANPEFDAEFDCMKHAYVTGNANTLDADADDVDNGTAVLISPSFDLSSFSDPHINYARYFYNNFGPLLEDDTLRIILSNGSTTAVIDKVGRDPDNFYKWVDKSIRVLDYMVPTANMILIVRTSDLDSNVNITEAGFDYFNVSNSNVLTVNEIKSGEFEVYPNPVNQILNLSGVVSGEDVFVFDAKGIVVGKFNPNSSFFTVDVSGFAEGMYVLQQGNIRKRFIKN